MKLHSQVSSLQWSPISGKHLLAVGKFAKPGTLYQANVFAMEQLLRGEEGLLFTKSITEPLAAQWSPWSEASLLRPSNSTQLGTSGLGIPMLTSVGLDGKEIGRRVLKSGTNGFLLCCHA